MSPCFWRLWALYLSATWSVYIPLCEFNWLLIFPADFFSDWILLRSTKEIKGFFSQVGMKFNWTGMSWTKTKCSFLCSLFALCLATPHEYLVLHWVLVWFSISVFLSFSLSGHGPFFPTYTRTQEYRKTHINVPHWHNSCWKGNLILAPVMNIHSHLLPAESF